MVLNKGQKYLSQKGILSRRKTEAYIKNGWIKVNQEVVTDMGYHIDPDHDEITFSEEIGDWGNIFV